ncbi:PREDICTED: uncharacterized protein LOC105567403 [Vollenhovia emeryi]|uniref:uncharacterized protein LOC105567403 n=1 Tax=Vollenhovia emeryi TaxID=411798 RepID=UPI0005F56E94|nr:PREDICTED: uncharacterized protein LOC105567403 [Vollenhovia emeryi]
MVRPYHDRYRGDTTRTSVEDEGPRLALVGSIVPGASSRSKSTGRAKIASFYSGQETDGYYEGTASSISAKGDRDEEAFTRRDNRSLERTGVNKTSLSKHRVQLGFPSKRKITRGAFWNF